MAQAGIHGVVGVAVRKWVPTQEWFMLGIVLGNLLPDADNLAVAVATLGGWPTEGLHRTFTHSLFTIVAVVALFYVVAGITRQRRWGNLGMGLGLGILMHILLDLVIWFNGVEILWPLQSRVNLWQGVQPADWWSKLMMPGEFLFFGLFFVILGRMAHQQDRNRESRRTLWLWAGIQGALFVFFTVLVYAMAQGFLVLYGAIYLLSLGLAVGVVLRMRDTIELAVR